MLATRLAILVLCAPTRARVWDIEVDGGAIADDDSLSTCQKNGAAFNATLAALLDSTRAAREGSEASTARGCCRPQDPGQLW